MMPSSIAKRSRSFPAKLACVSEASTWLGEAMADLRLSSDVEFAMALCLEEVFVNIVMHGHATTATLSLVGNSDAIRLEIVDDGLAFDPTRAPVKKMKGPLADAEIGGLGIGLLHRFSRSMAYRRDADRNSLTLEFARTAG